MKYLATLLALLVAAVVAAQTIPIGSPFAPGGGGSFAWTTKIGSGSQGSTPMATNWSSGAGGTPVAGETVVCALSTGVSGTWTVTDQNGDTYASTSQFLTAGNGYVQIFYSANISGNAGIVTGSVGTCSPGCAQICVSATGTALTNGALIDTSGTGQNSSTSGGTVTVNLTTAHNGEGIYCVAAMGNINGSGTVSAGTGFTAAAQNGGWNRWLAEFLVQSVAGAAANTATYSNNGVAAGMQCVAMNHS